MQNTLKVYRTKFVWSFIHFLVGGLFLLLVATWLFFSWFDNGRYLLTDLVSITVIILSIDLIIGPIFNFWLLSPLKSKRENTINFSCILIMQVVSLGYGITQIDGQRLAYIVKWQNSYFTVLKSEDRRANHDEALYHFNEPTVQSNERAFYEMMIKNAIPPIEMYEYFVEVSASNECKDSPCEVITKSGLVKLENTKNGMVFY
ncbi:fimbrial assembly protein [Pseudoalteromonas shioyasakiensis]|uniref:fimbrial assembly protein n=1 Tax=Pseudoalteromonas shioyasakiensis TaxID=1190813 RepID=UPI00211805DC|nr:fimbrial assembly protein [Pseudoalteromonas shioyasakiensis]MCQ8883286.1 fimbrial assembly protein [Pseudoalteromonas shioyasakiensis]